VVSFYSKRSKSIFIPWAIAVILLCTGSLINFHQHRIWGRPLLPQLIAHKKDVEKTQTDLVLAKINADKDLSIVHFGGHPDLLISEEIKSPSLSSSFYKNEPGFRNTMDRCIHARGLRAPPRV
jgi:hypothetical protein